MSVECSEVEHASKEEISDSYVADVYKFCARVTLIIRNINISTWDHLFKEIGNKVSLNSMSITNREEMLLRIQEPRIRNKRILVDLIRVGEQLALFRSE